MRSVHTPVPNIIYKTTEMYNPNRIPKALSLDIPFFLIKCDDPFWFHINNIYNIIENLTQTLSVITL